MAKIKQQPNRLSAALAAAGHFVWRRLGAGNLSPLVLGAICAGFLFVGLFYVWTRMQLVQIGYEISAVDTRNAELKNRKRELMLEIASMQSPKELEAKALKFGLTYPAMGKVVNVP